MTESKRQRNAVALQAGIAAIEVTGDEPLWVIALLGSNSNIKLSGIMESNAKSALSKKKSQ